MHSFDPSIVLIVPVALRFMKVYLSKNWMTQQITPRPFTWNHDSIIAGLERTVLIQLGKGVLTKMNLESPSSNFGKNDTMIMKRLATALPSGVQLIGDFPHLRQDTKNFSDYSHTSFLLPLA